MRLLCAWLIFSLFLAGASLTARAASPYSNEALIDGFNKTVFGSEYSGLFSQKYVHKFPVTVRFYVRSYVYAKSTRNSKTEVERFIRTLSGLIHGLRVKIVRRERDANFVVHVVNRADYPKIVRSKVYHKTNAPVRGRCLVRSIFNRNGIIRSDAVIVVDEGRNLFQRCMTEEILQGLGPLNDDRSLAKSMFNDTSLYTSFRRFDRFILNMLYDRRVKNGVSRADVQSILPSVLRRVRRRIEGGN